MKEATTSTSAPQNSRRSGEPRRAAAVAYLGSKSQLLLVQVQDTPDGGGNMDFDGAINAHSGQIEATACAPHRKH
jgi:hypothetical protein